MTATFKATAIAVLLYALLGGIGYAHKDHPVVQRHLNRFCHLICY